MKLSEAILLGIGAVRNDKTTFLRFSNGLCGCAIGTAIYSVGKHREFLEGRPGIDMCHELWPWTKALYKEGSAISIAEKISTRHYFGESRESLAAWIATIEPQEEPVAAPEERQADAVSLAE